MEFGRYKVLSQLGQGGMATVYLAEDPMLQRLVAVKVIQAHLSTNPGLLDRFVVEAKTAAALRNPNIVEIFDFGVQNDQQFLVMEYIDGQNLQMVCGLMNGKPVPNETTAAILCQAAEGLSTAEKRNVVHRDLKPENLMFNSEGVLKVADFGIAHIADEQSRTQTGAVLGSPNFMAPEQIEGAKPSHMTDMFALGGILYYCLSGKLPFTGPSIPVTMRNICDHPHPQILEMNPDADPELIAIADTLLQKNPEERGEGARWLSGKLRKYLNDKQVVDLAGHSRDFILTLGAAPQHTMVEASPSGMMRPSSMSASSLGSPSGQMRSHAASAWESSMKYGTQPTTGALGPSSRSPVWILSIVMVVVLAAALAGSFFLWQKNSSGEPENASQVAVNQKPQSIPVEKSGKTGSASENINNQQNDLEQMADKKANKKANKKADNNSGSGSTNQSRFQKNRESQSLSSVKRPEPAPTPVKPKPAPKPEPVIRKPEPRPIPASPPPEPVKQGAKPGFVKIKSSPPFATVTINGKLMGETPMSSFTKVPAGKVRVEIVHRLHPPLDTYIDVKPGQKREMKFDLTR